MCDGPDGDDYEAFSFYSERTARARKEHVCRCCSGAIAPGELYTRASAAWDGTAWSEAMCAACAADVGAFMTEHRWQTLPSGAPEVISACVAEEQNHALFLRRQAERAQDRDVRDDRVIKMRQAEATAARWQMALDNMKARAAARRAAKGV